MTRIAIVGAGYMGTATAWPLSDNGHEVRLVGTHLDGWIIDECKQRSYHPKLKRPLPEHVVPYYVEEVEDALAGVEIIVSGVNSLGVHWIGHTLAPYLRQGQIIIAVTKGLEADGNGNLVILPDVLAGELPQTVRAQVTLAAIGGPCIAGELAGRRHSYVYFGCRDSGTVEHLAETFRTEYYHVRTTRDLVGLEFCAALKNAFTLGVGLAAGLLDASGGPDGANAYMHNLEAATFAQACVEMDRMLSIVGGTRSMALGLPGSGDLFVTVQGGRTMRLGRLLGAGHTFAEAREIMAGETLEAAEILKTMAAALPRLTERGILNPGELPLLRALSDVIANNRRVDLTFTTVIHDPPSQL
jgi:glycerol-3-phosphate dehydrogenase (NAD(P)+)